MATVSDQTQHSYADADEFIQYQLEKARSRIKATDLLTAGVLAGLLLTGYVLIFTLVDHWVIDGGFGAWTRAILLVVILMLCGAILIRYVLRPWFRQIHPLYAARMLDRSAAQLHGSLLALVDLQAAGHKSDDAIHRTLEKRAAVTLAGVHVDEAIDRKLLTRMGTGLFIITLVMCVYAVLSPKSISLLRPLTFAKARVATRTVIEAVQPGNAFVPAGSHLEFVVDLAGVIPAEVRVLYSTLDRRFVDEPLTMRATDDEHRFQILMVGDSNRGIRQDLTYRIEADDATSESYTITVEQTPTARVTEIHYVYPAYMDLPDRTDPTGAIDAWEDTTLTLEAESSEPARDAVLQMSDDSAFSVRGEELPMAIDDTKLSVNWKLTRREDGTFPKFYRIQVTDPAGQKDLEPAVYPVDIRRDQPPTLKLIDPTRDLQVAANAIVPLLVEAEDPDFLLRSVTLHYAVNGELRQPSEVLLDAFQTGLTKRWTGTWEFPLKPLNLNPRDVVTFHLEARDNRPPLGNQSRTGDLNLQITAPLSEKQIQEQLAQDRQMQEQLREPNNNDPTNTRQNPNGDQSSEQPTPGENTGEPMPNEDPTIDPNQEQSPETETPSSNPQPKDPKNDSSEPKHGNDPQDTKQGREPKPPEQEDAATSQPNRRADDDKALQKIIERMNRDRKNPESGSQNDKGSSHGDDRASSVAKKTERPERESGEQGVDSTEHDADENSQNEPPRTDTGDARTPEENSGEDPLDKPAIDATGNEKNTDDQTQDTAMNEDGREQEKPTPSVDGAEKPGNEKQPIGDPGSSGNDDSEDPKNTEGDPKTDQPSKDTPAKGPADSSTDAEKSDANAKGNPGEQPEKDKPSEDQKQGEPVGKPSDKPANESGTDKPPMKSENPANINSKVGHQSDPNKSGNQTSKDSTADGEKADGEKGDGEKAGGEKGGGEKAGGEKAGGEKGGDEKAGGEKAGGEKGGGEKGGGEKGGGEKGGGEKGGGEKGGGEKGGGEKGGGDDESGGKQSGGGKGGVKSIDRADANTARTDEQGKDEQGEGGMPDGKEPPEGSQPNAPVPTQPADPQADDAAGAAALAIKRLQKDLERGVVDPKLLEELGWTESEIKSFAERLQKQLTLREVNAQQQKEKSISDKSFDAMLKGLDLNSSGTTRQGKADRDRDQQDTTTRQSAPPSRYKQLVEGYQRSVSGAKDGKPK